MSDIPVKRDDTMRGEIVPRREPGGDPWRMDPFRDLETIFDRLLRRRFDVPSSGLWPHGFTPAVDIEETDDAYVFEFELPGVKRDEINIEIDAQELRVSGEITRKERTGVLRHSTRHTGSFDYRVSLPAGVDSDRVEAKFDDGILTITIPRIESSRPRKVKVI